jgi:hypothetical protein
MKRVNEHQPAVGGFGRRRFPNASRFAVRLLDLFLRETKSFQFRAGQRIKRQHQTAAPSISSARRSGRCWNSPPATGCGVNAQDFQRLPGVREKFRRHENEAERNLRRGQLRAQTPAHSAQAGLVKTVRPVRYGEWNLFALHKAGILPQPCHNFLARPNFFHRLAFARHGGAACRSPGLPRPAGACCNWTPSQNHRRPRSTARDNRPRRLSAADGPCKNNRPIRRSPPTTSDEIARTRFSRQRHDFVIGVVKRRADQIVHRRVHDDKILPARAFHIFDARDQDAGVAGNEPARLDQDFQAERLSAAAANGAAYFRRQNVFRRGVFHQAGEPLASAG